MWLGLLVLLHLLLNLLRLNRLNGLMIWFGLLQDWVLDSWSDIGWPRACCSWPNDWLGGWLVAYGSLGKEWDLLLGHAVCYVLPKILVRLEVLLGLRGVHLDGGRADHLLRVWQPWCDSAGSHVCSGWVAGWLCLLAGSALHLGVCLRLSLWLLLNRGWLWGLKCGFVVAKVCNNVGSSG